MSEGGANPPAVLDSARSERLDHHGIVAAICDEIRLVETIDAIVPGPRREVSHGEAVRAMVLNALSVTGSPLYLTPEFYKGKPVGQLVGEGIRPEQLNDDALGDTLDALFERGLTEVFSRVAIAALERAGIVPEAVHLDSTTFSFHGEFAGSKTQEGAVEITRGYSKDRRPDLKQIVTEMICCERSNLPVWIRSLDGNSSDRKSFPQAISAYIKQMKQADAPIFVADAALYSRKNVAALQSVRWISRVPANYKDVIALMSRELNEFSPFEEHEGYLYIELEQDDPLPQRWLLIFSQKAHRRDLRKLMNKVKRERTQASKLARKLMKREFSCRLDAVGAIEEAAQKLKYHDLLYLIEEQARYSRPGRPRKGQEPDRIVWKLREIDVKQDEEAIEAASQSLGRFVLATNEMDPERLSVDRWLTLYKGQGGSVERGFRFLKDPRFFAEGMYLRKPGRIMAMTMLMGLSLLVYSLGERWLREALDREQETIDDQLGKPTSRPTLRRVFELFEGIEILIVDLDGRCFTKILNMTSVQHQILRLLGPRFLQYYHLA